MLMKIFQWTNVRLRYLDCRYLFVPDLQPVDSCIIPTYYFLFFCSVELSLLHYELHYALQSPRIYFYILKGDQGQKEPKKCL